jgi:hypothetical protein
MWKQATRERPAGGVLGCPRSVRTGLVSEIRANDEATV